MSSEQMKPCPFCGGDEIRDLHIRDGRSVGCATCGASVCAFNPDALHFAEAKWNTRPAIDDAMVEQALDAWDNVYEAEIRLGSSTYTDNRVDAMRAAIVRARGEV